MSTFNTKLLHDTLHCITDNHHEKKLVYTQQVKFGEMVFNIP